MSLRFDQLKELRDKTTIKGSYVFLSFSFYAYIFTSFGLLDFENIVNPLDLIYEYLLFLSFLSFTTLIFYYLKIEDFLLKNWLRLKEFLEIVS